MRRAILIGSSAYPKGSGLAPLRCPPHDVERMKQVLSDPEIGKFERIEEFVNGSYNDARIALNKTLNQAGKDGFVLIYFSGHGKLNKKDKLHLTTVDTQLSALEATSISFDNVIEYIDISGCRQVVVLLDCCFSGAAGRAFVRSSVDDQLQVLSRSRGIAVLTASTSIEVAVEKESDDNGLFTKHLLHGLESGEADENRDGEISADELFDFVYKGVTTESAQEPTKWGLDQRGKLPVAYRPRHPDHERPELAYDRLLQCASERSIPIPVLTEALDLVAAARESGEWNVTQRHVAMDALVDRQADCEQFAVSWPPHTQIEAAAAPSVRKTRAQPARVLAIDGGGVRALVPMRVLGELERRTGKPTAGLFDLIAGVSEGAVAALLAAIPAAGKDEPQYTASEIADISKNSWPDIFKERPLSLQGVLGPRYDAARARRQVAEIFGDSRLSDCLVDTIVPAFEIGQGLPFLFKSRLARELEVYDFRLADLVMAATAAPTFFPPHVVSNGDGGDYVFIDGAVFSSNPALAGYTEARRIFGETADLVVVSLGTGMQPTSLDFEQARKWGALGWLQPLMNIQFSGTSVATSQYLDELLLPEAGEKHYFRLDPAFEESSPAAADASPENLETLEVLADHFIKENSTLIDVICDRLLGGQPE